MRPSFASGPRRRSSQRGSLPNESHNDGRKRAVEILEGTFYGGGRRYIKTA
jgi:hypothetical protein